MEERKKRSRGETQNVSYRSDRHRCRVRRDEDVPDAHLQDDEVLLSLFAKFAGKSKKSDSINGKKVKKETVDLKNRLRNPGECQRKTAVYRSIYVGQSRTVTCPGKRIYELAQ